VLFVVEIQFLLRIERSRLSFKGARAIKSRAARPLLGTKVLALHTFPKAPDTQLQRGNSTTATTTMRWLLSFLLLGLLSIVQAASSSGNRLLVVLEELAEKSKYSKYLGDLEGMGI
jgi:hypothetical protein